MKKIIFVRHGKAEDHNNKITDFERSLTVKGKVVSGMMADKFRTKEKSPGIIITSPAFRALETAIIFAEEFEIDPADIIMNSNIYYNMNFHYLPELLALISEDIDTITLFGHNPSFTDIADTLCKEGCDIMPKSAVIGISFKAMTWAEIKRNSGTVEYYLKPEKGL